MPGGGRRRGAGKTHGRKDSGESKGQGEANKDEEACAVCVLGEVTAEQHFLAVELQEHPAALHGTAPLASGSCEGRGEYLCGVRWGFPPACRGHSLPGLSLPACAVHVVSFSWQVGFAMSETTSILESLRC